MQSKAGKRQGADSDVRNKRRFVIGRPLALGDLAESYDATNICLTEFEKKKVQDSSKSSQTQEACIDRRKLKTKGNQTFLQKFFTEEQARDA